MLDSILGIGLEHRSEVIYHTHRRTDTHVTVR